MKDYNKNNKIEDKRYNPLLFNGLISHAYTEITLRDLFAVAFVTSCGQYFRSAPEYLAKYAYSSADACLAARQEKEEKCQKESE